MVIKEKYIHTRNYGCRIRRYSDQYGLSMLSMENSKIKVVFALDKGADILELVYKPLDVDTMFHSFQTLNNIKHPMTKTALAGNFLDTYVGGWQDLFPSYGGPATLNNGGEIGIHGEACQYPWECRVLEDTPQCVRVLLTLRTIRSPFLLEKEVCLRDDFAKLEIRESVTNLGAKEEEFMWGQHPAFGWPFVTKDTKLRLKGTPTVTVPAEAIGENCPFDKATSGEWPYLSDKNGSDFDMSRAYDHHDEVYMEYGISGLADGQYELVNEEMGLGVRINWDKDIFPYIWVWGMYCGHKSYPWYGRAYTMAVEPWSCLQADFAAAKEAGTLLKIGQGEQITTEFSVELFCEK